MSMNREQGSLESPAVGNAPPSLEAVELMRQLGVSPLRRVAGGAISETWRVLDSVHHEILLFKHLLPVWREHLQISRRFSVEAEILKRVRGESILGWRASATSGELPAHLLEGFSGKPLEQELRLRQSLTPELTVWIGRQVLDGLCSLALIGFIHCDLRPEHILIDDEGEIRLTGFHSSQPMHFDRFLPPDGLERELFSPPWYQPPELDDSGIPAHPRQDLYQLGVILYQCLTGTVPFHGSDRVEIQRAHRTSTPRPIRTLAPHVPREIRDFVESLLFKNPLRRPQSLREVRDQLITLELSLLPYAATA